MANGLCFYGTISSTKRVSRLLQLQAHGINLRKKQMIRRRFLRVVFASRFHEIHGFTLFYELKNNTKDMMQNRQHMPFWSNRAQKVTTQDLINFYNILYLVFLCNFRYFRFRRFISLFLGAFNVFQINFDSCYGQVSIRSYFRLYFFVS